MITTHYYGGYAMENNISGDKDFNIKKELFCVLLLSDFKSHRPVINTFENYLQKWSLAT
jgi:hypothetical protein